MNYKYLNNIETITTNNSILKIVTIPRKDIDNISVYSDYNPVTDCNQVIIKIRKNGNIIESRTILDCKLFPKHLKRTKEEIKVYLESYETKNIQQKNY